MKLIPWSQPDLKTEDKRLLIKSFDSTWISGGYYIQKFEESFSKFVGTKAAISVNNGTSAISLVFQTLKLKPGDEIIIPGFGYLAAANLALQYNLKPIFVDVDIDSFCVEACKIEKKITNKTKLIVVINTYGNVCDLKEIIKIGKKYSLPVLEDSAESLGSTYFKKQSGTLGDFGTYSFQATKTITTGEGGMVIAKNNNKYLKRMSLIRSHGVDKKRYYHILPGNNYRLTNLQASIGYSQLKRIKKIKLIRKKIFNIYLDTLKRNKDISFQIFNKNVDPLVWTLAVRLNHKKDINRDLIIKKMLNNKIETRNGFYSPNYLKIFKKFWSKSLVNSDRLSKYIICLPFYNNLKKKEILYIAEKFLKTIS